ncbi:MAG: hypothetical protein ACHQQ3_06265 [Gemmatimonadales bacterium]
MRARTIASLAMLFMLPSLALAQGRVGGTGSTKAPAPPKKEAPRYPTVRDVEDHNPASLFVDKRKKLSLPDSIVSQLKVLEKTFKERNAPVLAMYDSVRRRITNSLMQDVTEATPGLMAEDQQNKLGMRNLWADLRQQLEKEGEEALALVPEAKKKDASDLLKERMDDFDHLMPGSRGRS